MSATKRALELLRRWAADAEQWYTPVPGKPGLGCYGSGFNAWGVQTNQKYLSAMAVLGTLGEAHGLPAAACEQARERALATLRYSLHSHVTGGGACMDGTPWGHTWITPLGVERMMHGVQLLAPFMTEADHAGLRAMLTSEAEWQSRSHVRSGQEGVLAGKWNSSGRNNPESNLWVGAILWRTAAMYPDHPLAGEWREQAHRFLINSVNVEADTTDERVVAGKPVCERSVGANFFPHYALDHHGYLNVGYMVICTSNAAMLHFDLRMAALARPESLDHHQGDLWQTIRRLIFSDGRLARIGGDSRLRYTYCQEYLLPSLVYAGDHLGDVHAAGLLDRQLTLIEGEAAFNGNGSFYGSRLAEMRRFNPYYYTRLESDRACTLGMTAAYLGLAQMPEPTSAAAFEASVADGWAEPEHGAVMHRSASRLASFSWRAWGLTQGLCQPPDDGHLAEWSQNLAGRIRFLGDEGEVLNAPTHHRELGPYEVRPFAGGFLTWGSTQEGVKLVVPEGWSGSADAKHLLAVAALPDNRTMVGIQLCRMGSHRGLAVEVKGLRLGIPNDLYNGFSRVLTGAEGSTELRSPAACDQQLALGSDWACLEGRVGAVGIYGAESLVVDRSRERRGGKYRSLYVDELCYPCRIGATPVEAGELLLDCGWAVLASADEAATSAVAAGAVQVPHDVLRMVRVPGADGREYLLVLNPTPEPVVLGGLSGCQDVVSGAPVAAGEVVAGESARLLVAG